MKRIFLLLFTASLFACNNNPEVPGEKFPDTTVQPQARPDTTQVDSTVVKPVQ
jgi:hypothetical protein